MFVSASAKWMLYFYTPYKSCLWQKGFQSTALEEELGTLQTAVAKCHVMPVPVHTFTRSHSDLCY